MDALFGNSGADLAKQQQQMQQRETLATLARQQGEVDQASSTGSKRGGRGLLTYLNAGSPDKLSGAGANKFGAA